jgi:hypothetical protein
LIIVWDEMQFAKNKVVKRIGIQKRNAEGKTEARDYITAEDSNASYPVITPLNETSSVVAYAAYKDGKDYVTYQIVSTK